jgi:hypothetical protein
MRRVLATPSGDGRDQEEEISRLRLAMRARSRWRNRPLVATNPFQENIPWYPGRNRKVSKTAILWAFGDGSIPVCS